MKKNDYGGWLFMYWIISVSSFTAFIFMLISCDFFKLALWAKCILIGVLLVGIFSMYGAWKLTHNNP